MKNNRQSQSRHSSVGSMSSSGPARRHFVILIACLILATPVAFAQAQKEPTVRPWWVGFELGDGQIKLTSDQLSGTRNPAFALGFVGGHNLGNRARIGLELKLAPTIFQYQQ